MLKLVHMTQYARRKPHQLSGGQRQRVALARSLAKRPKLLLLDEPMGALDKKLRSQMQLELVEIIERVGVTCVMVTHDQEEAMTMAQRIAIMHLGWIAQIGSPVDIYEAPVSRLVCEFIGNVNIFEGRCRRRRRPRDHPVPGPGPKIYVGHGIALGGRQVGDLRHPPGKTAGHTKPTCEHNWSSGKVHDIAYLGGHSVFYVELPSGKLVQSFVANAERRGSGRPGAIRSTCGGKTTAAWYCAHENLQAARPAPAAQRSQAGHRHSLPLAVPVLHAAVLPRDEDQLLRSGRGDSAVHGDLHLRRAEIPAAAEPGQLHLLGDDELYISAYLGSLKIALFST
jgi:hypothetical protein